MVHGPANALVAELELEAISRVTYKLMLLLLLLLCETLEYLFQKKPNGRAERVSHEKLPPILGRLHHLSSSQTLPTLSFFSETGVVGMDAIRVAKVIYSVSQTH